MPLEINSHASDDTEPQPLNLRASGGILARNESQNFVFPSHAEAIGDLQQSDLQAEPSNEAEAAPPKRGPGAPAGNQNNFRHGLYSKQLQKVKRGRLRGKAKKLAAETLQAVLQDQGPLDQIPVTLQWVIERFSKRVGRLRQLEHAVESLIERNPQVKDNGQVLSKLNSYLMPLEDATINDARLIGFVKKTATSDPLRDYIETNYSSGGGKEDTRGE
jgi:hypothetical protein